MPEKVSRRLAAVFAADMVGYSRLIGLDEEGTIARQQALRRELIDPQIAEHAGRIVKTIGDGVLVEFPSVVDAVRCAVAVQEGVPRFESDVPEDRRIRYRVGINLGDIVADGDDILGDGVNVAARVEGLAEAGGVCISEAVYHQIQGKIDASFIFAGEHAVKNIAQPVRVWRWRPGAPGAAVPALAFPNRPAIAVMPFVNMSGDTDQDYFVDGITEDIITALSKWRWFLVIARNSTFAYKGQPIDLNQVQGELAVRYVLEGSVRKAGQRVRITAQLIEAATGTHLWAERYDRELTDIFGVQDEITSRVAAAIEPALSRAESQRGAAKRPEHMGAWDYYQRGSWHLNKLTKPDSAAAYGLFKTAVALEPSLAEAHLGLARALIAQWDYGSVDDFAPSVREARESALRAMDLDAENPYVHYVLAQTSHWAGDVRAAISYANRAIELNGNFALGHFFLGIAFSLDGRHEEALNALEMGLRLSPRDPRASTWLGNKARVLYHLRCYAEAIEAALASRRIRPHAYSSLVLAASYAQLGRDQEATSALAEIRMEPEDIAKITRWYLDRYSDTGARGAMAEGLRKAGLLQQGD
jgi:adenylate cyclase